MPLAGASGEKNSDRSGLPNHIKFFHKSLTEVTFSGPGGPEASIEAWNMQKCMVEVPPRLRRYQGDGSKVKKRRRAAGFYVSGLCWTPSAGKAYVARVRLGRLAPRV